MFDNKPLVDNPYKQRLPLIYNFSQKYRTGDIIFKLITSVSEIEKVIDYCKSTFGSRWQWDNDGFIFNKAEATYMDSNFKTYKWKFPHHQTIDVKVGEQITGMDKYTYNINIKDRMGLVSVNKLYKQGGLFSTIPLSPSIVEVQWVKENLPFNFVMSRSRPDKVDPNYIDTVNSVWKDIQMPIPLSDLTRKKLGVVNKKMQWLEYRKYSNYRKSRLISDNIRPKSVILDVGFGKGGDIQKYKAAEVKRIYAFEPDIENIKEFFRRYNLNIGVGKINNLYVENINIILFNMDALSLKDPSIRSLIRDPLDTICLFFSLTYKYCHYCQCSDHISGLYSDVQGRRKRLLP
jgi:hypothetical protein